MCLSVCINPRHSSYSWDSVLTLPHRPHEWICVHLANHSFSMELDSFWANMNSASSIHLSSTFSNSTTFVHIIRFLLQPSQGCSCSCNIHVIPCLFSVQQQSRSLPLCPYVFLCLFPFAYCFVFSTPIALSAALYIRRAVRLLMQWSTPCIPAPPLCLGRERVFLVWINAKRCSWGENLFTFKAILHRRCCHCIFHSAFIKWCWHPQWYPFPLLGWRGPVITDRGPVDSTAVLYCWKHLVEVNMLCSQAATLEVMVAELCTTARPCNGPTCIRACLFQICLYLFHQSLSVQAVLGGGGVCGGGVVGQGAPAASSWPALQQVLHLSGHAAGESCVDPWVGARVQTGQQHQDGECHACWGHTQTHTL